LGQRIPPPHTDPFLTDLHFPFTPSAGKIKSCRVALTEKAQQNYPAGTFEKISEQMSFAKMETAILSD
jgi:hypothetical protein